MWNQTFFICKISFDCILTNKTNNLALDILMTKITVSDLKYINGGMGDGGGNEIKYHI